MNAADTLTARGRRQIGAFTLIEMIGVLAVIAILVAVLIPKVANAISDSRISSTVESYETLRGAAQAHICQYYAYNVLFTTNATPAELANWDTGVLIPEGLMDQPFTAKIGKGQVLQVVAGGGNAGNGYKLDGTNNLTTGNAYSVECVISNVVEQDAYDIATRLNGRLAPAGPGNLTTGCVEYLVVTNGTGTLYLYVAGL
jgi:type II secretory pathway pseudopilin PulG